MCARHLDKSWNLNLSMSQCKNRKKSYNWHIVSEKGLELIGVYSCTYRNDGNSELFVHTIFGYGFGQVQVSPIKLFIKLERRSMAKVLVAYPVLFFEG